MHLTKLCVFMSAAFMEKFCPKAYTPSTLLERQAQHSH